MKLSDRLTRAGLAFLIFGTCTALLPGNSGNFMTASDACTTGQTNSSSNTGGQTAAYIGGGFLIFLALDPSLYTGGTFSDLASSDTGSGSTTSEVGYNVATSEFQFDAGTPSQG